MSAMRLALIFNRSRADTLGGYYERACRALGLAVDHWPLQEAERIPEGYALHVRIDHGDDYLVRLPDRLRPAVFLAVDTHLPHSWRKIRRTAGWYDLVFCAHRAGALRLPGAEWLPVACDVELHGARGESPVRDLAFVGTDGGSPRKFFLQALRERFPNSRIGMADYREMGSIYGRARIGFNYSIANDVNMRSFEVLAAGTLLLTNALEGDDFHRLGLEDRKHLVLYRDPQELLERITHYLAHPDERRAIAAAGAQVARTRHTYTHRLGQLLTSVSQRLGLPLPAQLQEFVPCGSS